MTLTISLTPKDLAHIQQNEENITVVANFADTGDFLVVCASVAPFGSPQLTLGSGYQVYAANQTPAAGLTIKPEMACTAIPGTCYTLTGTAFLDAGAAAYPANIGVNNQSPSGADLLCGLEQPYSFNGSTPTFVPTTLATALYNQTVYLEQPDSILVFLSNMSVGQLVPTDALISSTSARPNQPLVVSSYLLVSLAGGDTTIYFDATNNCFTAASPAA